MAFEPQRVLKFGGLGCQVRECLGFGARGAHQTCHVRARAPKGGCGPLPLWGGWGDRAGPWAARLRRVPPGPRSGPHNRPSPTIPSADGPRRPRNSYQPPPPHPVAVGGDADQPPAGSSVGPAATAASGFVQAAARARPTPANNQPPVTSFFSVGAPLFFVWVAPVSPLVPYESLSLIYFRLRPARGAAPRRADRRTPPP